MLQCSENICRSFIPGLDFRGHSPRLRPRPFNISLLISSSEGSFDVKPTTPRPSAASSSTTTGPRSTGNSSMYYYSDTLRKGRVGSDSGISVDTPPPRLQSRGQREGRTLVQTEAVLTTERRRLRRLHDTKVWRASIMFQKSIRIKENIHGIPRNPYNPKNLRNPWKSEEVQQWIFQDYLQKSKDFQLKSGHWMKSRKIFGYSMQSKKIQ